MSAYGFSRYTHTCTHTCMHLHTCAPTHTSTPIHMNPHNNTQNNYTVTQLMYEGRFGLSTGEGPLGCDLAMGERLRTKFVTARHLGQSRVENDTDEEAAKPM